MEKEMVLEKLDIHMQSSSSSNNNNNNNTATDLTFFTKLTQNLKGKSINASIQDLRLSSKFSNLTPKTVIHEKKCDKLGFVNI